MNIVALIYASYNVNLVGIGASDSGCSVHPYAFGGWKHPVATMKMKLLSSASGIKNEKNWVSGQHHFLII